MLEMPAETLGWLVALLVREVLFRSFANRRQLASYVGITPMPYQSGGMDRDRSISRAASSTHELDTARLAMAALPARQVLAGPVETDRWEICGPRRFRERCRAPLAKVVASD
jgi:hypothetical protein